MATDTRLLLSAAGAIILLILLILRWKVSAFLALIIASLTMGIASGMALPQIAKAFQNGMGSVLGSIAGIIALGTILGKMLAESGGAEVVATTILRRSGTNHLGWAMLLIALVVGMPTFFAVGLVLLIPILYALVQQRRASILTIGIPMVAGLSAMHGFVPPHPGPMAAIEMIGADLGKTILYSLIIAIPAAILAGPIFARFLSKTSSTSEPMAATPELHSQQSHPAFATTIGTILLPILLMVLASFADLHLPKESFIRELALFLGHPLVALLIGVFVAFFTLGGALGFSRERILIYSEECLAPVALLLLVIGAGGGFSRVLIESGVGTVIADRASSWSIPPIPLAYAAACLIRIATGSATVAITTAAALVKPVADAHPDTNLELLVLAMGAGSLILSHVNDGGFWLVKSYLKLSVADTLKSWTVLETILSIAGFGIVLLLNAVL